MPICATNPRMPLRKTGRGYVQRASVNHLGFGIAIARDATSTVLFPSRARFCRKCAHHYLSWLSFPTAVSRLAVDMKFSILIHNHIDHRFSADIHGYIHIHSAYPAYM